MRLAADHHAAVEEARHDFVEMHERAPERRRDRGGHDGVEACGGEAETVGGFGGKPPCFAVQKIARGLRRGDASAAARLREPGFEVVEECERVAGERLLQATMRFETAPGVQAQIDWKESMTLRKRDGTPVTFNVFLMVLGFSRMKYMELTLDRSQATLFRCMCNAFNYFGGCPTQILFDNMRTVASSPRSAFGPGVINEVFSAFAADCGFEPLLCESFHPYTKGKVEVVAKLADRLRPYDSEFTSTAGLSSIVAELRDDLNAEVCQATGRTPAELHAKEKDHLHERVWEEVLMYFCDRPRTRRVSKDSCVSFEGVKYSVPPKYVGRDVVVKVADGNLYIFYGTLLVRRHELCPLARVVFAPEDYEDAVRSTKAFRSSPDDVIEGIAKANLAAYDEIGRM